jgi:hypothetical protein
LALIKKYLLTFWLFRLLALWKKVKNPKMSQVFCENTDGQVRVYACACNHDCVWKIWPLPVLIHPEDHLSLCAPIPATSHSCHSSTPGRLSRTVAAPKSLVCCDNITYLTAFVYHPLEDGDNRYLQVTWWRLVPWLIHICQIWQYLIYDSCFHLDMCNRHSIQKKINWNCATRE